MRRERRALLTAAAAAVLAVAVVACGGGGEPNEAVSDTTAPEETVTTRVRSDNVTACRQLRSISDISRDTARLSNEVGRAVVGGNADAVLAAAAVLADHLEATAPDLASAYAELARHAPQAVADAVEVLSETSATTVPELVELLRSGSADEVADLYGSFGTAVVPDEPDGDAGPVGELHRYAQVICDFTMAG